MSMITITSLFPSLSHSFSLSLYLSLSLSLSQSLYLPLSLSTFLSYVSMCSGGILRSLVLYPASVCPIFLFVSAISIYDILNRSEVTWLVCRLGDGEVSKSSFAFGCWDKPDVQMHPTYKGSKRLWIRLPDPLFANKSIHLVDPLPSLS